MGSRGRGRRPRVGSGRCMMMQIGWYGRYRDMAMIKCVLEASDRMRCCSSLYVRHPGHGHDGLTINPGLAVAQIQLGGDTGTPVR